MGNWWVAFRGDLSLVSLRISVLRVIYYVLLNGLLLFCTQVAAAEKDADTYYWQAVDELKAGLVEQAINDFELALFENPNHRGALIDLTVAICQTANSQRCDTALQQLQTLYPDHPIIQQLVDSIHPKRWQHFSQVMLGSSNNINQGLTVPEVALTINGLPVSLAVSANSLARSANYTDITQISRWQSSSLPDRWELQLQGYLRTLNGWQDNQLTFGQVQAKRRQESRERGLYWAWGAGLTYLNYQQQYVYTAPKLLLEVGNERWFGNPALQLQHEWRSFETGESSVLDTVSVTISPISVLQLQVGYTQDDNAARLGGNVTRWQWQALMQQPLSASVALHAMVFGLLSQDAQAYAPPVVDVQRATQQQGWQLGIQYEFSPQWGGQCAWRQQQQLANHPLFEWQESGFQCGLFVTY